MAETLTRLLRSVALANAERRSVVEGDTALTYRQVEDRVSRLAGALQASGVHVGDRIGVMLPNGAEFLVGLRAALACGAIVVPLDHRLQQNDLLNYLGACRISVVLATAAIVPLLRQAQAMSPQPYQIMIVSEAEGYPCRFEPESVVIDPEAPVMYAFTSGSTGRPKLVGRKHHQIIGELLYLRAALDLRCDDRFLGVAPFCHVNGLIRSLLSSQIAGACLYPVARFERRAVIEQMEREHITSLFAVPFIFCILAEGTYRRRPDLGSLRWVSSASAVMPIEQNRLFHRQFGMYVRQSYGSTEVGTATANLRQDIADSLDSVGSPLPGIEVGLFDESHRPVPAGSTGEIGVRGATVFDGYVDAEDLNHSAFHDGYFLTGDLGRWDERGMLYLSGRARFQINRAGIKVDPWEIEQVLLQHPGVGEVAVVGIPSSFGDDRIKAVIVLKSPVTANDIVQYCRGRIADFKVPSIVEFRDSLPKSITGKLLREQLKD